MARERTTPSEYTPLTVTQTVRTLRELTKLPKHEIEIVLDAYHVLIAHKLADIKPVKFPNVGTIMPRIKKDYVCRDPRNGEMIVLEEQMFLRFKLDRSVRVIHKKLLKLRTDPLLL